jgi:hypothetical protein
LWWPSGDDVGMVVIPCQQDLARLSTRPLGDRDLERRRRRARRLGVNV